MSKFRIIIWRLPPTSPLRSPQSEFQTGMSALKTPQGVPRQAHHAADAQIDEKTTVETGLWRRGWATER